GTHISNLQLHSKELRFHFFVRSTDITQAAAWCDAVIDPALRNKLNAIAGVNHTKEIFAIVVSQESRIPWSRSLGQLPANEPGGGLHMQISFPLPCQPLGRRKVGPERSRNELSLGWPISERGPWRRKKRPSIRCLPGCLHLVRDLVRGKQVVRVEPLNVIAAAQ